MAYIQKYTKEYPVTIGQIKQIYNKVKFPEDKFFMAPSEYAFVEETEQPAGAVEGRPETKNGKWFQTWVAAPVVEVPKKVKIVEDKAE